LLWFTLRKRGHIAVDARLKQKAWRIILAAAIMGVALYFGNERIEDQLATGLWRRIAVLFTLVSAGGAVYALAILLFGAYRISELKSLFRRRAIAPAASASE
jgi:putative peptidoglycan lipid II flippase